MKQAAVALFLGAALLGCARAQIVDLGGGLPGTSGTPNLLVQESSAVLGGAVTAVLVNAKPGADATLVVGLSAVYLPIFGGILIPYPDLTLDLETDASGQAVLPFEWPFPTAVPLYVQYLVEDDQAPEGFAFSNTLEIRGVSGQFHDLDGGTQNVTKEIFHQIHGGFFKLEVPPPSGAPDLKCVWAFYANGSVVNLPLAPDYMLTTCELQSSGVVAAELPYSLNLAGGGEVRPYSYILPSAGSYVLRVWIGDDQIDYTESAAPSAGVLAQHDFPITVTQPEVVVDIPSRNSLTSGSSFDYQIRLASPVAYDRYFTITGIGGVAPSQGTAVIYANTTHVQLSGICHYPSGRISVRVHDSDGSAIGGDAETVPGSEIYVSSFVACVDTANAGGGSPGEASYSGPYYGEQTPRPAVGDYGPGTECKHAGGAGPNSTGMPSFKLCGPCKLGPDGNDRKICQNVAPGTNQPLSSEPVCGPAHKFISRVISGQHGSGGYTVTDASAHCVVTEANEQVQVYKLDSSGTEECAFIGFSLFFVFGGFEALSKYCCYYSLVDAPAATIPVRRCTTIYQ